MIKLTLILISLFALTLSSCKEEEKEHFMFLKFLAEARNPEEFFKSSIYFDSTCTRFKIDFKAIEWYSELAKQNGFKDLLLRSSGIQSYHYLGNNIIDHTILIRLKGSHKGRYPVGVSFMKNEKGVWKLCRFNFLYN